MELDENQLTSTSLIAGHGTPGSVGDALGPITLEYKLQLLPKLDIHGCIESPGGRCACRSPSEPIPLNPTHTVPSRGATV